VSLTEVLEPRFFIHTTRCSFLFKAGIAPKKVYAYTSLASLRVLIDVSLTSKITIVAPASRIPNIPLKPGSVLVGGAKDFQEPRLAQ
jgi:hypothetical protein